MSWRDAVQKAQTVEKPKTDWRSVVQEKQSVPSITKTEPTGMPVEVSPSPVDREETRAAQSMPEFGQVYESGGIKPSGLLYGEDKAKVAALAPVLMTVTNPEELGKILKENFPNIGIQYDEGGNILAANNKTGVRNILNRPGMSQRDWMEGLGITALMMPAGRAAGIASKVLPKMALGGAAAAATQAGIEGAQEVAGGTADPNEVALAGAFGAGGEALGAAVSSAYKAFKATRAAKGLDVARQQLQETIERIKPGKEALDALEQATGVKVNLFQAQQTMNPTSLLKQRLLPQLEAGSRDAAKALEKQNSEVFDATAELLNKIAGPEVVETGAKRFRSAAQRAIEAQKEIREAATGKLYKEAMKQGADVDLSGVKELIAKNLERAKYGGELKSITEKISALINADDIPEAYKITKEMPSKIGTPSAKTRINPVTMMRETVDEGIQKTKKSIVDVMPVSTNKSKIDPLTQRRVTIENKPTLSQLQNAKFQIDAFLAKEGSGSLHTTTKKRVLDMQKKLVEAMEEASPAYKVANDEFKKMSPAVEELENSIVGTMSKYTDVDLQNISSRIFSANSNPFVVKKAKAVIEAADPGAWDDMMRVELQRRIGGLDEFLKDASPEVAGNVPGALRRAIFGSAANLEKRRTLMAALSPEQRKNFTYLDEVLRRASSGRGEGSPTGAFTRIMDKMKFKATGLISSGLSPAKAAKAVLDEAAFNREVAALTEIMFDPNWQPKMKQIRNLTGSKADKAFFELYNVVKASTQTAGTESNDERSN